MVKSLVKFFDKLEDKIRGHLSHYPIFYAFIGGIGLVLFWRGIWHFADDLSLGSISSMIFGIVILLLTGVFVSSFIGNRLIISGLVGEKKLAEKEKEEIETEEEQIKKMQNAISRLEKKLDHLDQDIENIEKH